MENEPTKTIEDGDYILVKKPRINRLKAKIKLLKAELRDTNRALTTSVNRSKQDYDNGFIDGFTAARNPGGSFKLGDHVRKISGSQWSGRVVGMYSTTLTPEGYAVESDAHPGSVQIYPVGALERVEVGSETPEH